MSNITITYTAILDDQDSFKKEYKAVKQSFTNGKRFQLIEIATGIQEKIQKLMTEITDIKDSVTPEIEEIYLSCCALKVSLEKKLNKLLNDTIPSSRNNLSVLGDRCKNVYKALVEIRLNIQDSFYKNEEEIFSIILVISKDIEALREDISKSNSEEDLKLLDSFVKIEDVLDTILNLAKNYRKESYFGKRTADENFNNKQKKQDDKNSNGFRNENVNNVNNRNAGSVHNDKPVDLVDGFKSLYDFYLQKSQSQEDSVYKQIMNGEAILSEPIGTVNNLKKERIREFFPSYPDTFNSLYKKLVVKLHPDKIQDDGEFIKLLNNIFNPEFRDAGLNPDYNKPVHPKK